VFYTDRKDAREILQNRQQAGLMGRVNEWFMKRFGQGLPFTAVKNMAVLPRAIATCRYEDFLYRLFAQSVGLNPTWMEYTGDKFVSVSRLKLSYLKPNLYFLDEKGNPKIKRLKLADITFWDGKKLRDIQNYDGDSLVSWHHRRQDEMLGGNILRQNISDFFGTFKMGARDYYTAYLAFFVAHAVLFEDYHGVGESGNKLGTFTQDIFEPAFEEVSRIFGVKPLIVTMPWYEGLARYPEVSSSQQRRKAATFSFAS